MLIILYSLLFIIFLIILLLSSPTLSPIPYFPTNKKDLPIIIKALNVRSNQTIVDLGAGDGTVIFAAANASYQKKLNTQFLAVEINPILILIMHLRRLTHPNKKNIKIIWGDLFKNDFINFINFKNSLTIYLYVSPWLLEKIVSNIQYRLSNISYVTYMYPIKSLKSKEKRIKEVKHDIFVYD
ncbi:MAG: hypothetical protein ACK4FL_03850 [Microgenomates group bacterium]